MYQITLPCIIVEEGNGIICGVVFPQIFKMGGGSQNNMT